VTVGPYCLTRPDGSCWAWVAVAVEPVGPTPVDVASALERERAWLAGLWRSARDARIEARYLTTPRASRSGGLRCFLLGQVFAADRAGAVRSAMALRDALAAPPAHVHATPVDDPAEVAALLAPVRAHPEGMIEVRKGLAWAWSNRPERRMCFAVSPYRAGHWQPLWERLLAEPAAAAVGICLEPYEVSAGERAALAALAQQYAALAVDNAPVVSPVRFATDQFAAAALPLYQAALRRYVDRAFLVRVSAVSEAPMPRELAERIAASVTPSAPESGLPGLTGGAVAVPVAPHERAVAWNNLTTMSLTWLEDTYRPAVPPGYFGPAERFLSEKADLTEAAAVFRLPYEDPGRPPLFDGPRRRRQAEAGRRITGTIVVAHDEVDADAAELVDAHLRLAGLSTWRVNVDLLGGARRGAELRQMIEQSRHVVVCLSTRSVDRAGLLQRQLHLAVEAAQERPAGAHFIIPVLLDPGCPLPARLRHADLVPVHFDRPDGPRTLLRSVGVS
jgi:TIR domain